MDHFVDLVLCIDGTLTMNNTGEDGKSFLDGVKETAKNMPPISVWTNALAWMPHETNAYPAHRI